MMPARARLPAYRMSEEICAAVQASQVTLILGATGCGKTTQIPQFILEDSAARGETCRVVASQPRRISAHSVAERVAKERGGKLGGTVAYKIRFEDQVTENSQIVFCTVGILLKIMQSNPTLQGATHIIVDEVHERDLHTDFMLILLRRVLGQRADMKLILMSATVDPSAFQAYFPDAQMVTIPGKTNYPIEEMFLEDILQVLPGRERWRRERTAKKSKVSPFSQGPLPGLPSDAGGVAAALPACPPDVARDVAFVHGYSPEDIDFEMVQLLVEMIHAGGEEGGILIFMPGWFEISETLKKLQGSAVGHDLEVHPLHSRMPTAEQQAIFLPPSRGKRKVIVATILAETSITVEDIVFVIDTGRTRSTFFNDTSMVSALRTVWYSKANGFQRRGRSGRCRPGVWYRLFSSLQWEAFDDYSEPEMLRSPLEELCLEVASLGLGQTLDFLAEAISPPSEKVVQHAVRLLYNLGAVADADGARLTPLGEKLSRLQVHPMLGKMLLIASLFRCFKPIMTICASLGYKSPFLCPMGKEREANAAKAELANNSQSDLMALANAYDGWCAGGAGFANRYFLSHQTLNYIHHLRKDLSGSAKDILSNVPNDHSDPEYLGDVCRAVLVAGLFPNLAWVKRMGKGWTLDGLKVTVHPGSVNSKVCDNVVAFYDIQETTDRWMYDTTVVSMAPCLLFAPRLEELHRGKRVVFRINGWEVAVDPNAADILLALRALLADFIDRSVGHKPTSVHTTVTDALSGLFSEHVASVDVDAEDEGEAGSGAQRTGHVDCVEVDAEDEGEAGNGEAWQEDHPIAAGDAVNGYWPEDDTWLPAKVIRVNPNGSVKISWDCDSSVSNMPMDYVQRPKRALHRAPARTPKQGRHS